MTNRRIRLHAAALLVLLVLTLPAFGRGVAIRDEGVYLAQVDNLAEGGWWGPRQLSELDPNGDRFAVGHGSHGVEASAPYVRHALYPLLLTPAYSAAGLWGVLTVSLLGTWLAALLTGLLAGEIRPEYSIASLWLTGAASPLVFDAFTVVGQSLAAAACAGLLLAIAIARRREHWMVIAGAGAAAAILVAVRSEGMIAALAIGVGSVAYALFDRSATSSRLFRVCAGAITIATACLTYVLDGRAANMLAGVGVAGSGDIERDPNPLSSGWVSLLRPWATDNRQATVAAVLVVVAPILAALALRLGARMRTLGLALLMLAAASALALQVNPRSITGFLPAFPLLVPALLLVKRRDLGRPLVAWLLGASALSIVGLLATIYGQGGAQEWGGRFFHVLVPMLVPVMVVGLSNAGQLLPRTERRVALCAAVVLSLSVAVVGLRVNLAERRASAALVTDTLEALGGADDKVPPVFVATLEPSDRGRYFWKQAVDGPGVLAVGNLGGMLEALDDADSIGLDHVVVVSDVDSDLVQALAGERLEKAGWQLGPSQPIGRDRFHLMELSREDASTARTAPGSAPP